MIDTDTYDTKTRSASGSPPAGRGVSGRRLLGRLAVALAALGTLGVLVWMASRLWGITNDDAAISFTYARNLAQGHGLVLWPGGERVEAYSNTLWVMLLALAHALGVGLELASKLFGILAAGGTVVFMTSIAARLRGGGGHGNGGGGPVEWKPWDLVPGLALVLSPVFVLWSVAGLENALFALLLVWIIYRLMGEETGTGRARGVWSALLMFGLVLTRPEAPLYLGAGIVHRLVQGYVSARSPREKRANLMADLRWLALIILLCGLFFLWRRYYFGLWLPNTYYIKNETFSFSWFAIFDPASRGWKYLIDYFREYGQVWVAGAIPFAFFGVCTGGGARLGGRLLLVLMFAGGAAFFPIYSGGDWMYQYRFLTSLIPLVLVLGWTGLYHLVIALPQWWGRVRSGEGCPARVLALVLVLGAGCGFTYFSGVGGPAKAREIAGAPGKFTTLERVGNRGLYFADLARHLEVDAPSLLEPDLGGTSFLSGMPVIDLFGLADTAITRHRWNQPLVREYLFKERRPAFIHLHGAWIGAYRLEDLPELSSRYIRLPNQSPGGYKVGGRNYVARDRFASPFNYWGASGTLGGAGAAGQGDGTPDGIGELLVFLGANYGLGGFLPGESRTVSLFFMAGPGFSASTPYDASLVLTRTGDQHPQDSTSSGGPAHMERARPLGNLVHPTTNWQPGESVLTPMELSIPDDLAPGDYLLQVQLSEQGSGGGSGGAGDRQQAGLRILLGQVQVGKGAYLEGVARFKEEMGALVERGDLLPALWRLEGVSRAARTVDSIREGWLAEMEGELLRALVHRVEELMEGGEYQAAFSLVLRGSELVRQVGEEAEEAAGTLGDLRRKLGARFEQLGDQARAEGDPDTGFQFYLKGVTVDPARARARLKGEELRPLRRAYHQPQYEERAWQAGLGYNLEPSEDNTRLLLEALGQARMYGHMAKLCWARGWEPDQWSPQVAGWVALAWEEEGDLNRAALWGARARGDGEDEHPVGGPISPGAVERGNLDFEEGSWRGWTVSGKAFGPGPTAGPVEGQTMIVGYTGQYLANSYREGRDRLTGQLSVPLDLAHRDTGCVSFLVGGGGEGKKVGVELVVDGVVVKEAAGRNDSTLRRVVWPLEDHWRTGQVVLRVVDGAAGGAWGHVLFDDLNLLSSRVCMLESL